MGIVQKAIIVVPCYNEAERLDGQAFLAYADAHPSLSFLFVDDGSTDRTFEMLTALSATRPKSLQVLRLEKNSGKGEAVRRGVLSGFDQGTELIGFWDADLATPLSQIERFAAVFSRGDVVMVFGSRVRLLGRSVERKAARHYIGRGFATLAGLALQLPIYDTQCGAKLFRAEPRLRALFERPFEFRWTFDVELFARLVQFANRTSALDLERQLVEYPLEEWRDAPGSKLRLSHVPRIAWELAKLFVIAHRK